MLLTDADEAALQLARVNAERNGAGGACCTLRLEWGAPAEQLRDLSCQLVLAAEVVYACAPARALAATTARLLADDGVMLLAHQERFALSLDRASGEVCVAARDEALDVLRACLLDAGLHVRELARRSAVAAADSASDGDLLLLAAARDAAALAALPLWHET